MSNTPTPQIRFPLWLKLSLLMSLLVAVPLLVLGNIATINGTEALTESIRRYHDTTLDNISILARKDVEQARQALWQASRILSDQGMQGADKESLLRFTVESSALVDFVSIYDSNGEPIDSVSQEGVTPPAQRLDPKLMEQAKANINGAALGSASVLLSSVRIELLQTIKPKDGEITGYVKTLFPLTTVQERVEVLGRARDEKAKLEEEYYVLDEQQRRLVDPDQEQALRLEVFSIGIAAIQGKEEGKDRVVARGERTREDGVVLLSSAQLISGTPWSVAVETPRAKALVSVTALQWTVWTTVVISLLASIISAVLLATTITKPIQTLVGFAKELSARKFSARVSIRSRDELSILGSAMSQAAADLESSEAALKKEVEIRTDLGRYMPKEVVERVVRREQSMALGGEKRQVSVLFADVVGFTPLSEKLSPEDSVAILNHLFTVLTEIVFRHQGTVDKFIGDCVMAFFGAPTAQEDHAAKAVAAAEDMIRWLDIGNASWKKRYGITIQLAIGVNTGEAIVGNIGSETRMEYTAIGDVVNVAARLESVARPQQILISKETMLAAGDQFEFLPMGEKSLVGREKMVEIFEVVV
jgi:adenylate cyclase